MIPVPGRESGPERSRDKMLARAMEIAAHGGISHLSLRQLATEMDTSHRMLIYHFGSQDGLIAEIVQQVEQQQLHALQLLMQDDGLTPVEQSRRFWEHVVDAAGTFGPLFFELTGQALQGRPHTASLLDQLVHMWLEPLTDLYARQGVPVDQAPAHARLGLAAARGLLLDLLVTGDRAGVDAALELLGRMVLAETVPR